MNPILLGPVLELGSKIIERLFPDPEKKAAAEFDLLKMLQDGDLKVVLQQLAINLQEAAHPSWWVAGWRPYFGWTGGTAFLYATLLRPILGWVATINGWPEPPEIESDLLWVVVTGLLGIGGLRSIEKVKGTSK